MVALAMALGSADGARGKAERIRELFSRIAPRYDLVNRLLSLGLDRLWRAEAAREALTGAPASVLDVATGTGDLAFALKRRAPGTSVTGIDFAEPMLTLAREKAVRGGLEVEFLLADGSALPFEEGRFGAVTVAYGLRNFADVGAGLAEFYRVLAPGGRLVVLEFTDPGPGPLGRLVSLYCRTVLPAVGGALSGRGDDYAYLPASIEAFASAPGLAEQICGAGFRNVRFRRQGPGISTLHLGDRPL